MEKISGRQLVLIGTVYILNATLITVPSQIIGAAKMDAWLSYIGAMLIMLLAIWALSKVTARFPGQDLFGILVGRHPVLGRIISTLLILHFYIIGIRDTRVITDFVSITLLPNTPIAFLALIIIVTCVLMARGGIEVLARMTELWQRGLLLALLLVPFMLYRDFDMKYMQPVLDHGLGPPLVGGWYAIAYIGEIIALPFIFSNSTFRFRTGAAGLAIGMGMVLLLHFYTVLSLGVHIPSMVLYPSYEMIRQIRLTDFLDRFDLPLVGLYLPTILVKIAITLYIVVHGLKRMLPSLNAKELMLPMGALMLTGTFWFFKDAIQLLHFNRIWPIYAILCQVLLPCLFGLLIRNKKKQGPSPSKV